MLKKFRNSVIYKLWARFLTWFGDIMVATQPPKVKALQIRELLRLGKPGDIICRKYTYYFDSYFIKGKYTHSGIITDSRNMIHSVAEGVSRIDIIDFVKDADGFVLIRPAKVNIAKMKIFLTGCIGKPYDFIFKKDKDAFYCHELTWNALLAGGAKLPETGEIIYADDLLNICKTIYDPGL